jgi:hypothetical protein
MIHNICNRYLDCLEDSSEYFKLNILKRLGPLLLSNKPIHLFCFRKDFKFKNEIIHYIDRNFKDLKNIKYKVIPCMNDTVKILFYNVSNINEILMDNKKRDFLKREGHSYFDNYNYYINFMSDNLMKNKIPKEIGIFFGYPVKDVMGYIGHDSLECTKTQGWKVYGDSDLSDQIYEEYIEAEEMMDKEIQELNEFESIRHLIKKIDNSI